MLVNLLMQLQQLRQEVHRFRLQMLAAINEHLLVMISERPGANPSPGEPRYTREEVRKRDGVDGRPMWVTYKNGVYDITEFCRIHPGGHIIKQAAGSNVEIFWQVWSYHHLVPKVGAYLDELRIGTLDDQDSVPKGDDPYSLEPVRSTSKQRVLVKRPYCSETPNSVLASSYITPADALYVRNHAPVPDCAWEASEHQEIVFEKNDAEEVLTIAQLKERFPIICTTSVLQCAGIGPPKTLRQQGRVGLLGHPLRKFRKGCAAISCGRA